MPEPTIADEIRNVAGLASLTLALIGYFTNQRAEALKKERSSIGSLDLGTVLRVVPEALLFVLTVVALIAMAPLLKAFDAGRVGERSGALPTLFALIWAGFAIVALFQLWLIGSRLWPAWRNRRAEKKAQVT